MTDSKALIERLNAFENHLFGPEADLVNEAADHIEKLEADNARLREELSGISGRLKVMREALIHTAGICNPISGFLKNLTGPRKKHLDSVQDIARAALQETSHAD